MNPYLVSILVPIFGVEKYIERCAKSLFEQTYKNIEYIFVDDCSKDKSINLLEKVIKEYPEKKDYIKIIHHHTNRGLAAARNTAIENSRGEFIMHVDSDDWIEKDAVEHLVNQQIKTCSDMVIGAAIIHRHSGNSVYYPIHTDNHWTLMDRTVDTQSFECSIWRRLIRRKLLLDNNIACIEGINMGEDIQVTPRLCYYAQKISWTDDVVYHYNMMNESSYVNSGKNSFKLEKNYWESLNSWYVLRNFFKGKTFASISERIENYMCFYSYHGMQLSALNGHKLEFLDFKKIFNTISRSNWYKIGNKNRLIVYLKTNYYILRVSYYRHDK